MRNLHGLCHLNADETRHISEAQRSNLKDQILNAEIATLKDFHKATGYLIRAEMYGARTSQRRVLGMVAAVRRVP